MVDKKIVSAIFISSVVIAAAAIVACSDSTPSSPCPTQCGTGMVCDANQGKCIPATGCANGCGTNATCAAGTCKCNATFADCDGNLGVTGGNGCECSGTCNAGKCSGSGCTVNCGANTNCANDVCSCQNGYHDCNGNMGQPSGDGCECNSSCSGSQCGGAVDAAIKKDIGSGKKDTGPGVDTGGKVCDYNDKDACGKDSSKWCYQAACISCSTGFFNCNNTKGCECDKAGCNGTACAGRCSGGECPP